MNRIEPWNDDIVLPFIIRPRVSHVSWRTREPLISTGRRTNFKLLCLITIVYSKQGSNSSRICCQTCRDTLDTHTPYHTAVDSFFTCFPSYLFALIKWVVELYMHRVTSSRMDSFANLD
jgi:hypothetical protein